MYKVSCLSNALLRLFEGTGPDGGGPRWGGGWELLEAVDSVVGKVGVRGVVNDAQFGSLGV
jgi:hypothetical protein